MRSLCTTTREKPVGTKDPAQPKINKEIHLKNSGRGFSGVPVAKTLLPMQGARIQSLTGELRIPYNIQHSPLPKYTEMQTFLDITIFFKTSLFEF